MIKCSRSSVSRIGQKESFFNDNTLSDVTIKFGCESIQAHKVILAQGSDYFKKMFCRSFKEANAKEIQLFEDKPLAVKAMIRFLYGLKYQSAGTRSDWQHLQSHALVYAIAEKYNLDPLKTAVTRLVTYNFADFGSVVCDVQDFISSLRIIWSSTTSNDTQLRPLLADRCAKMIHPLIKRASFVRVMRDTELGADLLVRAERELAKLREKDVKGAANCRLPWG